MKQQSPLFPLLQSVMATLTFFLLSAGFAMAQKDGRFTGMLEYKITVRDTNLRALYPENRMLVYTNDTIVRTENATVQLGIQVNIHHLEKNKAYLLLDTEIGKFAIPSDYNSMSKNDSIPRESKYHFRKKGGSKKILGRKAKRMLVTYDQEPDVYEFWYDKKISNKYNQVFPELPGLPVKYSVVTPDAVLDYELIRISEYTPDRDLFGIPSNYERVSFDEFINRMIGEPESPE